MTNILINRGNFGIDEYTHREHRVKIEVMLPQAKKLQELPGTDPFLVFMQLFFRNAKSFLRKQLHFTFPSALSENSHCSAFSSALGIVTFKFILAILLG